MRIYELLIILRSSLSEEKRKKLLATLKSWLKDVKIVKEDAWGQKALAYPIKNERIGYYHFLSFESENGLGSDLEKRILGQEDVLRHLLLRKK